MIMLNLGLLILINRMNLLKTKIKKLDLNGILMIIFIRLIDKFGFK